jgi:hypothetical protein
MRQSICGSGKIVFLKDNVNACAIARCSAQADRAEAVRKSLADLAAIDTMLTLLEARKQGVAIHCQYREDC